VAEQIFVQSNGGSGTRWWTRGPNDTTLQTSLPAAYRWILDKRLLQWNHNSMAVYTTDDGSACCLLNGLRSGKVVGNSRVLESLLLISPQLRFTAAQRRLATSYLRTVPDQNCAMVSGPGEIGSVLNPIHAAGDVEVDWSAMADAIEAIPNDSPIVMRIERSWGEDNCENRALLGALINQWDRHVFGDLVAVVAPFARKEDFGAAQTLFGLSQHHSLKRKRLKIRVVDRRTNADYCIAPAPTTARSVPAVQSSQPPSALDAEQQSSQLTSAEQQPAREDFVPALNTMWERLRAWFARLFSATHPEE
jgi:hypothetical protein